MQIVNWVLKRLSEPSSAAGVSGIASGALALTGGQWQAGILAVLTGVAAVIIPDKRG